MDEGKTVHWSDRQTYSGIWIGILVHASNCAIKDGHDSKSYISAVKALYYSLFRPQREKVEKWKVENPKYEWPALQMFIEDILFDEGWFTKEVKVLRGMEWRDE